MTSAVYAQDADSIRRAREFVAGVLSQASAELRERAVLITSELATNAIRHAHSTFTVTADLTPEEVYVTVTDTGQALPLLRHPQPTEPHGRGLMIVNALADRWGIDTQSASKTVWFALALRPELR